MIREISLRLSPRDAASEQAIAKALAEAAGGDIGPWRIKGRSIDARQKQIKVNLRVDVAAPGEELPPVAQHVEYRAVAEDAPQVVIVGAGPAGLFAALRAIERGLRPVLLERGRDVEARRLDIAAISRDGRVDPESNYCFGEGGAGAYSDGKLYTRSKKRGSVAEVLAILHQHGASDNILVDAHPHIGSDRLPHIIRAIRERIIACGGQVRFGARVEKILLDNGDAVGVECSDGTRAYGPVVLATGHSARDVYRMLHRQGIEIEAKGLAIGVRLEHPQEVIDRIQYHSPKGRGEYLPAAEYSFVTQVDGRGVYSFCMCPGGVVVPSASGPDQNVVNGMSASARSGRWANAGMVVEVHPEDFPEYAHEGPLAMLVLQENLERSFYQAVGNTLKAPAQRMTDFIAGRLSGTLPASSYPGELQSSPIHFLLPDPVSRRLRKGLEHFGRRARGFATPEATVLGLESRTSSPVRIPRDAATGEHVGIRGLYPAGEGAGYAGGIVSAAIDGRNAIDALVNNRLSKE